jgi:hypothetical protein
MNVGILVGLSKDSFIAVEYPESKLTRSIGGCNNLNSLV